jgi:hypothetical protein
VAGSRFACPAMTTFLLRARRGGFVRQWAF